MKLQTKVVPFIGYNTQALEAAEFYVSIIPDSKINRVTKNHTTGTPLVVEFELGGLPLNALNAGEDWARSWAFSLSVACDNQTELDAIWNALSEEGQEVQCGWVTDKYGISWQVVPAQISEWISDPARGSAVLGEVMKMVKIDIATLQRAYEGVS